MRPGLEDTLAAPIGDPSRTVTAARRPAEPAHGPGLATGQQLGHFRIERLLGAGGMGEVYLATDLALERPVAIKVLVDGSARDATQRDRLVREARAQARITHPNVGHIYFIGEEAGRLYFAMEYVSGETLSERVAAGPLPPDDALAIVRSAALGLREAQRHGITHRDIKPSNLMVDSYGMVKVLDFGLAAGALGEIAAGPVAQTSLAGTPLYMAPEQARGEPVDLRADIYALGATLYHLVSGRPPFEADTLDALLSKHSSAERPVLPRRSGQPRTAVAAIDALVSRMMAPRAGDRFASYDELIRALELASVDHMRPAGLWVRSMALSVDFVIALLAAAVIILPIKLVFFRHQGGDLAGPLPGIAFVVYQIACLARTGRTLGEWLFELEVVDVTTGTKPSLRRAAIRVVVPVAVPIASAILDDVLDYYGYKLESWAAIPIAVLTCLPPFSLLWASIRSVTKQAFWDRLSHTMVRYRVRRTTSI